MTTCDTRPTVVDLVSLPFDRFCPWEPTMETQSCRFEREPEPIHDHPNHPTSVQSHWEGPVHHDTRDATTKKRTCIDTVERRSVEETGAKENETRAGLRQRNRSANTYQIDKRCEGTPGNGDTKESHATRFDAKEARGRSKRRTPSLE